MNKNNCCFISSNVKGIKSSGTRMKVFEYLKQKINQNGFIFMQETNSCVDAEKNWQDEFKGPLFFAHGKANSCGVAIGFCGNDELNIFSKKCDDNGRILMLETKISDEIFLLINLYNTNLECDQLTTFSNLLKFFEEIDDISNKSIISGGDFNLFLDCKLEAVGGNPSLKKKKIYFKT